jgi:tetratricopeptide (TPR) repeat protein
VKQLILRVILTKKNVVLTKQLDLEVMKKIVFIFCLGILISPSIISQNDKAVLTFARSIELEKKLDYVSAIETMLSINDSTSYEVNLRLGWLSYKASQKKKSLNYYYKAIQLMPKAIEPRYGYGFPAYLLEDYSDLIEQDKKILEIDPNSKTINGNLGSIYYYSKEYKKALPYFEKVVSLYPFDYDNNLMLGWTNLKLGKNIEAEKYFNVVLLYSPKDASAKEGLLATKNIVSTNEKTLAAFYKSYELSEKSDQKGAIIAMNEVYDASSYFINLRLGWLNYLAGMQPESVKYYKIACDLMPVSVEAKLGFTIPAEVMGNTNDLRIQYDAILKIDPLNTLVHYKLGVLDYGKKNYQTASVHFQKIVDLYPCDADALLMLAWCNNQLGNTAAAKPLFNKVLCLSPNNVSALQGLGVKAIEPEKKHTGF